MHQFDQQAGAGACQPIDNSPCQRNVIQMSFMGTAKPLQTRKNRYKDADDYDDDDDKLLHFQVD